VSRKKQNGKAANGGEKREPPGQKGGNQSMANVDDETRKVAESKEYKKHRKVQEGEVRIVVVAQGGGKENLPHRKGLCGEKHTTALAC